MSSALTPMSFSFTSTALMLLTVALLAPLSPAMVAMLSSGASSFTSRHAALSRSRLVIGSLFLSVAPKGDPRGLPERP